MSRLIYGFLLSMGLLVLTLSVRAAPATCTDKCVMVSTHYNCSSGNVMVSEKLDCLTCQGNAGWVNCQPPETGGTCLPTDETIGFDIYDTGFEVCPNACQNKSTNGGTTATYVHGMPSTSKLLRTSDLTRFVCKAD